MIEWHAAVALLVFAGIAMLDAVAIAAVAAVIDAVLADSDATAIT